VSRYAHALGVGVAVARRPRLWVPALAAISRFIPNGWVRGGPLPSRAYLDYRGPAVYGMPLSKVPAAEVIRYLEWCKAFPGPVR